MLTFVKLAMRIPDNDFDVELQNLIDACKSDLVRSGLAQYAIDENDPDIKQAITMYCNAYFGPYNPDMERYARAYDSMKANLIVCGGYAED